MPVPRGQPDDETIERLKARFERFAEAEARGSSPLYFHLGYLIAGDSEIAGLLAHAPRTEQRANLLFAAVHYLLLSGVDHPLRAFYGTISDPPDRPEEAFPVFQDFCADHRDTLVELIATRGTQTNEVRRCAYLLPMFGLAAARATGRPLALLEIGPSAGLNLNFDRYYYEYSHGVRVGATNAVVRIACEVRGPIEPPVPPTMPSVAWRAGIDPRPVDVNDVDGIRWLRACIWPEHLGRTELLERAVGVAREHQVTLIHGDGIDLLAATAARSPDDALLCVFHTNVAPYLSADDHQRLEAAVLAVAETRDLCWIVAEGDSPRWRFWQLPTLDVPRPSRPYIHMSCAMVSFEGRRHTTELLGLADAHAAWIEWLQPGPTAIARAAPEDRDAWFDQLHAEITEYYLAEPDNPYRQSGRSQGHTRWVVTRQCIAKAVNAQGDYLDIGCANGLLLESLLAWCAERGFHITPHGIDFVPDLIELAKLRLPRWAENFEVANAWDWTPKRQYRFVQVLTDAVPKLDRPALVQRTLDLAVAPGGRLIVPQYGLGDSATPEVAERVLHDMGFEVAGSEACVSASVAWVDKPSK